MRERALFGIFGGTFNPIHVGHLRAAEEVVEALRLERMIFVPSAQPPHKESNGWDSMASAAERLAWTRQAVLGNTRFEVDDLEVKRGGASFTVETLRSLGDRAAPMRPVFSIGCDAFAEMDSWREPEVIFTLADFAVTTRPPVTQGFLSDWLPKCVRADVEIAADGLSGRHCGAGTRIHVIEISALDVSASDIRRRLRDGHSIRYLVPESVREAVVRSGTYS